MVTRYLPARHRADIEPPELELLEPPTVTGQHVTYPTPLAAADRIAGSGRSLEGWDVYALNDTPTTATVTLNGLEVTISLALDEHGDDVIASVSAERGVADLDPVDEQYHPRQFVVRDWR